MSAAHNYEAALLAYQAAYALRPASWLLINIGRVNQKLGRLKEAIRSYREFLAREGQSEESDTGSRAIAFLAEAEAELAQQQPEPTSAEEQEPPPAPLVEQPTHPTATQPGPAPDRLARPSLLSSVLVKPGSPPPIYKRPWFIGLVSASSAAVVLVGITIGSLAPSFDRPGTILYPTK